MENFLRFLITPLLTESDKLRIEMSGSIIFVILSPEDAGRVIGKKGSVINSIRILAKTYCALHKLPPVGITVRSLESEGV